MAFKYRYKHKMYRKRKHYLNSIKVLVGCQDCPETDPDKLTFDHVRGEKLFDIGSKWDVSLQKVQEEVKKCDVVCYNCHAKRTIKRLKEKSSGLPPFVSFPKIARLSREIIVSEKLDGTNAVVWVDEDGEVWAGSKNRWLFPEPQNDNHGFAQWVMEHEKEFQDLGASVYRGEWIGKGIQRGYGLEEKRFYLFNPTRWIDKEYPKCCEVVPIIYQGIFTTEAIEASLNYLKQTGSVAVPTFMKPEGIVIYHTHGNFYLKKTIENDEKPKSVKDE